jgi:hypothetical protein
MCFTSASCRQYWMLYGVTWGGFSCGSYHDGEIETFSASVNLPFGSPRLTTGAAVGAAAGAAGAAADPGAFCGRLAGS